jgi:hypothetical protein
VGPGAFVNAWSPLHRRGLPIKAKTGIFAAGRL